MAKRRPDHPPVQVPFRVPPDFAARLKIFAEVEGKSINQTVQDALDAAMKARGL